MRLRQCYGRRKPPARIQSIAGRQPQASLLVSETVYAFLPGDARDAKLEEVSLKGKSAVVKLYKIGIPATTDAPR